MVTKTANKNQSLITIPTNLDDPAVVHRVLLAIVNRLNAIGYYESENDTTVNEYNQLRPKSIVATTREDTANLLADLDSRLSALEVV